MALNAQNSLAFITEVAIGLLASLATFYLFILTSRVVSWKKFFNVTGFCSYFWSVTADGARLRMC
ncbi:hypothetical protein [Oligella urethralis]|uniref:hypothetical protein n=1 Tax=Oligella urethralis TaxID=90245 RepID=UPI0023EA68BB|nr:hypothetical protein [Oligella urethralis]